MLFDLLSAGAVVAMVSLVLSCVVAFRGRIRGNPLRIASAASIGRRLVRQPPAGALVWMLLICAGARWWPLCTRLCALGCGSKLPQVDSLSAAGTCLSSDGSLAGVLP